MLNRLCFDRRTTCILIILVTGLLQISVFTENHAGISILNLSVICLLILFYSGNCCYAQRQMENLKRGVVAVSQPDNKVFVSWRLFGTDPEDIAFNVYRIADDNVPGKGQSTACYRFN